MSDYLEITSRLLSAVLIGGIIGIDRSLRGKPSGMKTLGLVAMGASLATMAGFEFQFDAAVRDTDAVSRVIQGIITGIGFLGAGVIVHESGAAQVRARRQSARVRGLTTAASIWVTAAIGIVCGIGRWKVAGISALILLALFIFGRPLERALQRRWMRRSADERAEIDREEDEESV